MEKNKLNAVVNVVTKGDANATAFVGGLKAGDDVTFNAVGDIETFNGNQWVPVTSEEGYRVSLMSLIQAKGLNYPTNKIKDRATMVIGAVEKGLKLHVENIEERPVYEKGTRIQAKDANGNLQFAKTYTYSGYSFKA